MCWYSLHSEPPADSDRIFCLSTKHRIPTGRTERQTEVATFDAQCESLSASSYLDAVVLATTLYMLKLPGVRIAMTVPYCALPYYDVHASYRNPVTDSHIDNERPTQTPSF